MKKQPLTQGFNSAKGDRPACLDDVIAFFDGTKVDRSTQAVGRILSMLKERTSTDFTPYKPSLIARQLDNRMKAVSVGNLQEYADYSADSSDEIQTLRRELLIGVTGFFRDPKAFARLQSAYLPLLIERPDNNATRIWVAGCATGEEVYTIAIAASECQSRAQSPHEIKIFATDIDADAIATAKRGLYPEKANFALEQHLLSKYFHREENEYRIDDSLREMITFSQHNLLTDPPISHVNLISCRNLLIYLRPIAQQRILHAFAASLNPGGILFLGTSETVGDSFDLFALADQQEKIYRLRSSQA